LILPHVSSIIISMCSKCGINCLHTSCASRTLQNAPT
jgi:hypothetical protein